MSQIVFPGESFMRWLAVVRMGALLVLLAWSEPIRSTEAAQPAPARSRSGITVWDTGKPSAEALDPAVLAGQNHWTSISFGQTPGSLKGDAVLSNGRIAAVVRKQDSAVEVSAVNDRAAVSRVRLRLMSAKGEPAARLKRLAIIENTRAGAGLEATFETAKGTEVGARFRIKRGEITVQAEPGLVARLAPGRVSGSLRRAARFLRR